MDTLSIDGADIAAQENYQRCLNMWNTAVLSYYDDAIYQASSLALSEGDKDALRDLFGSADCLAHMCSFTEYEFEQTRDRMRDQVRRAMRLTDLAARSGLLIRRTHHKGDKAPLLAEMQQIKAKADDIISGLSNEKDAKQMARRFAPLIKRIGELEGMQ